MDWSHYIPPIFQIKSTILGDQDGIFAALPHTVLAALLTAFNWAFIIRLKKEIKRFENDIGYNNLPINEKLALNKSGFLSIYKADASSTYLNL